MNNEELKKKIVDILVNCKSDRCAIEYCAECDGNPCIENCREKQQADALIAAGIGDVKEAEMAANRYEMLYSMQARDMALAERKAFTYAAEIEHLNNKLNEAERRAARAEREAIILSKWLADKTRKDYPYQAWLEAAQKQAKKELAEEKEDD